ncbi:hypothetical protein HWD06_gp096 [Mycobacterium phage Cornie]|uniref:Uncharacterized protein n=1 Tax=Mycobacterium phage Cornie TaxID=2704043 RepID=A0A6G6XK33_9CAUD|nr:hypothetical protein HWD06_gp096 [Mycobacterium phage Cornie]QIG58471.1 hypothetical protein SEA_CORNIE_96 [Mycobacterium phage Cornie]
MRFEFTAESFHTIATCISRGEHLTFVLGETTATDLFCERCGELSVGTTSAQAVSSEGVYDLGPLTVCLNCKSDDEEV